MPNRKLNARFFIVGCIGIAIALLMFYISLTSGTYPLTTPETFRTLFGLDHDPNHELVIFGFRMPRIVIGALVGLTLGMVGAVLQGVTRNDLADPGILGIQSAVGLAVVLYMFVVQGNIKEMSSFSIVGMSVWGWIGGMITAVLLFLFSRDRGELDPKRLILVGIALNAGFSALTLFISLKMNPQDFEMATVWLSGSIYSASWEQVISLLPWAVCIIPFLIWKAPILNVLQFDEVTITGLGVRANRERIILLFGAVGLISASVIVSGSIAFVGLLAPHISRRLVGIHHQHIIPISGVVGSILILTGDWIGKTLFAPAELPVGIVISIIGVPYFIYLLIRNSRKVTS
ncbi:FecCD family ABC transporter permease [Bacillus norwichensis]|uniref:Iron ABC transporter permease n=1 Tax=Bacillus norwichensis TaxID=2762217 RepID=A0ABR8VPW9_9BACI|nr:iron ABC transporter permease [Bacillus norwichensis]MBD8006808.1 iron ABC transporter permease [Bacillus norwichensis]